MKIVNGPYTYASKHPFIWENTEYKRMLNLRDTSPTHFNTEGDWTIKGSFKSHLNLLPAYQIRENNCGDIMNWIELNWIDMVSPGLFTIYMLTKDLSTNCFAIGPQISPIS